MNDIYSYIDDHLEETVLELKRFCSLSTVSAENRAIDETASYVTETLESYGLRSQVLPKGGDAQPVVYGEKSGDSGSTILFYNHYDVQPPDPLDSWSSPPFEPQIRDGKIYARGVCDNKGNIIARLAAIRAITAVRGGLPCSVKFCIEGDEEIGSPRIDQFVDKHRDLLKADVCIWEGMGVSWDKVPRVVIGVKGLLYVELSLNGAPVDIHSSYATVVPNPAWRLTWALSSIKNSKNNVLIDGFYDGVIPPTPEEIKAVRAMPDDSDRTLKVYGLNSFINNLNGGDYHSSHVFEPTATINGLVSGYTGPGPKTILPSTASAKLDFRLVPNQDPHIIFNNLRSHLDRHGFSDIEIKELGAEHPARTAISDPWVKLVAESVYDVYGKRPIIEPNMPGTGPLYPFVKKLGLPTADCGVGNPDSRPHAPDENIEIDDFLTGTKAIANIISKFR